MKTYPEMNSQIVALLRLTEDPATAYAAQRIEELEAENLLLAEGNLDSPAHMEILRRYYEKTLLAALTKKNEALDIAIQKGVDFDFNDFAFLKKARAAGGEK